MKISKNIIIYLSMQPEEGGKFQYSLSFIESALLLKNKAYNIIALYKNNNWINYLKEFNIEGFIVKDDKCTILYKLKKIIVKKMNLIFLWRLLAKWLDPMYKTMAAFHPVYVCYPGTDSLSYELPFNSIVPIFDLMHRYESFEEVSTKSVYRAREKNCSNICKYSKAILVDSSLGKKHVLESYKVDSSKIFVLPYVPPFYVYKEVNDSIINKYNLFDDFLFYPAQFWSHKNHIVILNAIKLLSVKHGLFINAVFVGSEKNSLENVIYKIQSLKLNEQIRILGYVSNEELVAMYKKSFALVYPSYFGPTNIPPIEALALDCPIIVADIYANREQLGDTALFFNPKDPGQLAEIILSLKKNYRDYKKQLLKKKLITNFERKLYSFHKIDFFMN